MDKLTKGLVKKAKAHVIIRLLRFFLLCFYLLLLTGAVAVEGTGPPTGAIPADEAGPPACILQMRFPMLTLARAFANKPVQNGSTLTPVAVMKALILSSRPSPCPHAGRGRSRCMYLAWSKALHRSTVKI